MKKILFPLIAFLVITSSAKSQVDYDLEMMKGSTLILNEKTRLTYEVEVNGNTYDFIVHIKNFTDGITFDYEMTNDEKTSGTIHISPSAIERARSHYNYFSGGPVELTDQITVWISKAVFNELIEEGSAEVEAEEGRTANLTDIVAGHDFTAHNSISGEDMADISYVYAADPESGISFWIHLSKSQPIILKMKLGWTITLKDFGRD